MGKGNDPRYNNTRCFDPFPFPADVPEPLANTVRTEAEALDSLRKRVLAEHDDLTLTKLYNVLEALRSGRELTDIERDIHDRGLVTLIRRHHDAIDAAVAQAYGWPANLAEEEILTRLVALNRERAAEESRGLIRYLRPEFQDPGYQAPINERLDLGETMAPLPDNIIAWPKDLPAQIGAVQSILSSSPEPLAAQDIARAFKGKRAATVRPVLDALAGVGLARRTGELGIVLEDEQADTGKAHVDAIASGSAVPIIPTSRRFYATQDDRRRLRQAAAKTRDKHVDPKTGIARPALGMSLEGLVAGYLEREPTRSIVKGDDPVLLEARRRLDEDIDHDRLFLASSRYHREFEGQEYRFLDDESLVRAFGSEPEVLVDRDMQDRLRAIEAIQLDKRRMIAAALVSGAAKIVDGELDMEAQHNTWAKDFWSAQRSDPTFHRLIQVAYVRPDRFAYVPGLLPGEATRKRALLQGDHVLAESIERELSRQRKRALGLSAVPVKEPSLLPRQPVRDMLRPEDRTQSKPGSPQSRAPDDDRKANSRPSKPWQPPTPELER